MDQAPISPVAMPRSAAPARPRGTADAPSDAFGGLLAMAFGSAADASGQGLAGLGRADAEVPLEDQDEGQAAAGQDSAGTDAVMAWAAGLVGPGAPWQAVGPGAAGNSGPAGAVSAGGAVVPQPASMESAGWAKGATGEAAADGAQGLVAQTAWLDAGAGASPEGPAAQPAGNGRKAPATALGQRAIAAELSAQKALAPVALAGSANAPSSAQGVSLMEMQRELAQGAAAGAQPGGEPPLGMGQALPAAGGWDAQAGQGRGGQQGPSAQNAQAMQGAGAVSVAGEGAPEAAGAASFGEQLAGADVPTQERLTEQVTYWISETIKNAELTLDAAGQAVDVRISLSGQEAHVAFRTDHAETRALLDGETAQLRALMQREGLDLAGVTVGAQSGGSDAEAGRERPQGRARTAQVQAPEPARASAVPHGAHGRTVDVFV